MALRRKSNIAQQQVQTMVKQGNGAAPGNINMIGEGTLLEGTLRAEGDVRISGRIVGKVQVDGKVIVAQEGSINGELFASSADIAGSIEGQLKVSERIVLKNTARVNGDIVTGRLVVEEGAMFEGKCVMESGGGRTSLMQVSVPVNERELVEED